MQRVASSLLWASLAASMAVAQGAHACGNQDQPQPSPNWHEVQRYAGSWTIVSGDPAPWREKQSPSRPDTLKRIINRNVGRHIVFEATHIRAPSGLQDLLSCKNLQYSTESDSAGELFQGSLGHSAQAQAAQLGFDTTRPIPTFVADCGCGGGVQFHAANDNELLFAIDNAIYRMRRDTPASASKEHSS